MSSKPNLEYLPIDFYVVAIHQKAAVKSDYIIILMCCDVNANPIVQHIYVAKYMYIQVHTWEWALSIHPATFGVYLGVGTYPGYHGNCYILTAFYYGHLNGLRYCILINISDQLVLMMDMVIIARNNREDRMTRPVQHTSKLICTLYIHILMYP